MNRRRFSAALSHALARKALREAATLSRTTELAVAGSTAAGVAARVSASSLDAIVIDDTVSDAPALIAELAAGPDKAKLLIVSPDPSGAARKYPVRRSQFINSSVPPADLAHSIIERVRSMVPDKNASSAKPPAPPPLIKANPKPSGLVRRDIVVLGCSTGGPEALATVLRALPARFPVPIVIVQHMPPAFTGLLAERLNNTCALTVKEVTGPVKAQAGEAWIAPGHSHIKLTNSSGQIEIDDGPEENNCKPAVDVLFRSATSAYGLRAIGVILTGMGDDGLKGGTQLSDSGAYMIAQDEATSVVWGMPGAAVRNGIIDAVVPLSEVASEVSRQFRPVPTEATA